MESRRNSSYKKNEKAYSKTHFCTYFKKTRLWIKGEFTSKKINLKAFTHFIHLMQLGHVIPVEKATVSPRPTLGKS